MCMRLLHTADWHLGHTLHDIPRAHEHEHFLKWLLATLEREAVDVLLIAGDVFETSNPRAQALQAWYGFIAALRHQRFRHLEVIVVGGNHDSAHRLDAPQALYKFFGFHVIGGVPYTADGDIDVDAMVIPLRDGEGRTQAWCGAVPYLRPSDLPSVAASEAAKTGEGPLVGGVRQMYKTVMDKARDQRKPGQALVAMGHLMMDTAELSPHSERKIQGGNRHAVPVSVFDEDLSYVALGHLHRAQAVGGRSDVRYSGSPIPLSMTEASYPHQVLVVDLDGEHPAEVRSLRVPRLVDMIRIPESGTAPLATVIQSLTMLPKTLTDDGADLLPFLSVYVTLERPEPTLRERIERSVSGRAVRLLSITPTYSGDQQALADVKPAHLLDDLTPTEVFVERHERTFGIPPDEPLLAAFHTLVEVVQGDGDILGELNL